MAANTVDRPVTRSVAGVQKWLVAEGVPDQLAHDIAIGGDWTELKGDSLVSWLRQQATQANAAPDVPKRNPKDITAWLVDNGMSEEAASKVQVEGNWRKFKDPGLLSEFLQSRVEVYRQTEEGKQRQSAIDTLTTKALTDEGYLTPDTDYSVALANWQRDNNINAGNGVLDGATLRAFRDKLVPEVKGVDQKAGWNTLIEQTARQTANPGQPVASHPPQGAALQALTPSAPTKPAAGTKPAAVAPMGQSAPPATVAMPVAGGVAPAVTEPPDPTVKLPKNATDSQILDYIHKNFSDVEAWLKDPEMRGVIFDAAHYAATHGGVVNRRGLEESLHQTKYWLSHPNPASRQLDQEIAKADGTADQHIKNIEDQLRPSLTTQGIHLDDSALGELAKTYIRGGWGDNDLNRWMADRLRGGGMSVGATTSTAQALVEQAKRYGIKLTSQAAKDWALGILDGSKTQDTFDAYVLNTAKGNWVNDPGVLNALDAGVDPATYFAPHVQTLADIFEVAPNSIDIFNDPKYASITRAADPKTGVQRAMTPVEAAQWARNQVKAMPENQRPRWWKQQDSSLGLGLARLLGAAPQGGL